MAAFAITAGLVAEATDGRILSGSPETVFDAVSIDSRSVGAGELFVALKGDRFDGHTYLAQAQARGAKGALVSAAAPDVGNLSVIQVRDTLAALQDLAREIRRRSATQVVAITGSAGKTTTKEITADLLASKYRVFRNRGNLNNHIGLPLSLTGLAGGWDMAVVELGMNHAGEIRELMRIAEPQARVWTNVGDAHIGYFGSREAVASAKAEILERASAETKLFANVDDAFVMMHASSFRGQLVTFGLHETAAVRAIDVDDRGFDGITATAQTRIGPLGLRLALPGRAHLMNVLAGVAVAVEYGIGAYAIEQTVAAARPVARRGAAVALPNGARLIDDTYNASPAAMQSMLQSLAVTPGATRRIAVLGEMLELGDGARALHETCGRAAAAAGVDLLVAVGGAPADGFLSGATSAGFPASRTLRFADAPAAGAAMPSLIRSGDLVLVKGSHGTRTDLVVDAIVASGKQG